VIDESLAGFPEAGDDVDDAGGIPAVSARRASSIAEADVISDGFSTIVLPAARAGASDMMAMNVGEFHGVITPTTPSGSRSV
jgi:hypothetical protein